MNQGYGKLCPSKDCPSKHAKWQDVLSAPLHCLPPVSVPMETKQDVTDQLQTLNLTLYGALIKLPSIAIP